MYTKNFYFDFVLVQKCIHGQQLLSMSILLEMKTEFQTNQVLQLKAELKSMSFELAILALQHMKVASVF